MQINQISLSQLSQAAGSSEEEQEERERESVKEMQDRKFHLEACRLGYYAVAQDNN